MSTTYGTLLWLLTFLSGDKLAIIMNIFKEIEKLLETPGTPPAQLEIQSSPEEEAMEAILAQRLSAEAGAQGTTQAAFDGSRLRKIADAWAKWGPTVIGLLGLFGVKVPTLPGLPGLGEHADNTGGGLQAG